MFCRRPLIVRRLDHAAAGSGALSLARAGCCSPWVLVARRATNAEASRKMALASKPRCNPEFSAFTGATCDEQVVGVAGRERGEDRQTERAADLL
jgi:hypothetical protein